jgi:hypothetical protein
MTKKLHILFCSSPLQFVHAHLVRRSGALGEGEVRLFCEPPISPMLIVPGMWDGVTELASSKRQFGDAIANIRKNLEIFETRIDLMNYDHIHLVISDVFWLMNNVALAALRRKCEKLAIKFSFSILDEGAILYFGARLSWKRTLRCWARSLYLIGNRLDTVFVSDGNADYRNALCERVFCLHPKLIPAPSTVDKVRINPDLLDEIYGDRFGQLPMPPASALYLSQPLYVKLGVDAHMRLVLASRDLLEKQGVRRFFYKAHHFDTPEWTSVLESRCGLEPIPNSGALPIEVWARRCNAEVVFSHFSSALLNLGAYGFMGRVVAAGLNQLMRVFRDTNEYHQYIDAVTRIGGIEMMDLFDRAENRHQGNREALRQPDN